MSHPAWVCGLKPTIPEKEPVREVTPCVGVWIETFMFMYEDRHQEVTPCVGVWIETFRTHQPTPWQLSHPAWVCGLKQTCIVITIYYSSHTLRGCVD